MQYGSVNQHARQLFFFFLLSNVKIIMITRMVKILSEFFLCDYLPLSINLSSSLTENAKRFGFMKGVAEWGRTPVFWDSGRVKPVHSLPGFFFSSTNLFSVSLLASSARQAVSFPHSPAAALYRSKGIKSESDQKNNQSPVTAQNVYLPPCPNPFSPVTKAADSQLEICFTMYDNYMTN